MNHELFLDAFYEVLENVDIELRWSHPEIFEIVDAAKIAPNRKKIVYGYPLSMRQYRWKECPWCGDDFVATKRARGWQEFCSSPCSYKFKSFTKKHKVVA